MRLPRWIHAAYARLAGYFWLPCPLCGENFGGHEIHYARQHEALWTSYGSGMCVCLKPECQAEAKRRNTVMEPIFALEAIYYDSSMRNEAIRIPAGGAMNAQLRPPPSQRDGQ